MLGKHILGYLPTAVLSAAFNFASLIAYTRVLEPSQFGRYALVLASAELIQMTCFEWVALAHQRFFPEEAARGRTRLLRSTVLVNLLVMALLVSFVYAVVVAVVPFYSELRLALLCGLPYIVLRSLVRLLLADHRASIQIRRYGLTDLGQSGSGLGFGLFLTGVLGFDERGALFGMALGSLAVIVANARSGTYLFDWRSADWTLTADLLRYGLPMLGIFAFAFVLSTSDRFFIEYFLGTESVAQYAAIYMLLSRSLDFSLTIVQPPMNAMMFATMARDGAVAAGDRLKANGGILLFIGLPAAMGLIVIAEPLAHLVTGAQYSSSTSIIAPGVVIATFLSRIKAYFVDEGFHLAHRTDLRFWTVMPAAMLKLMLSFVLIPRFGLLGVVFAMMISDAVALATSIALVRRVFPVRLPLADLIRVIAATAAMAAVVIQVQPSGGVSQLVTTIAIGIITFGSLSLVLDTLGLRRGLTSCVLRLYRRSNMRG